ncbi:hypothetical protein [Desulfonatronovibrio magnus]|uniref:hypothetical protein n=1 Tax=Desulfonatronovibrio magnus TaxID=698827 RepID=UPI0005EB72B9|nr:hypothetical protein [Desulfonatronovibrio magnus]
MYQFKHTLPYTWPLILLLLAACATPQVVATQPVPPALETQEEYWWYVRFGHVWPEGEGPAWHRDVLLADRIISPVLAEHGQEISLWRVHRRAARDSAGHRFSFIFRATPEVAARINARIGSDPLLERLLRDDKLKTVGFDDPAKPQRPGMGDTSDPGWTPEMQRAWPHYIMGVSRLWLELIHELAARADQAEDLDSRYVAISAELDNLWLHQGSHALLHHLNAVFGYQEVNVIRREGMRF